ncbi:hypothetical protein QA600_02230 [Natronococcus sp. A-GB1]|uniref:hypothetical protein n=1 Tax=Natronococcus sp. A-GB1 TaxID=3037648 RepID=UPI00241DF4C2|nr:hypothetical protein [Natronococcus sp. A-GB1]MDG5758153.1 hypothetical protein [Natronococcus sp. A-GB1]
MEFAVSREGTTLVTLHGGSNTTAREDAAAELEETFESLATEGTLVDWAVTDAEVHEPPSAPFDPYTIAIEFDVVVTVEADDAEAAGERGAETIDAALAEAGVDSITYRSSPTASA